MSNHKVLKLLLQLTSAKARNKIYIKVKPHLVRHILCNRLLIRTINTKKIGKRDLFNTYSMKQPDLYYFGTIKMTSQA